jgi:hypothetical protein
MAANLAFLRKLIADDLWDTLYFVSAEVPQKSRTQHSVILEVPRIRVEIFNNRKIYLNGQSYRFGGEVKKEIQREFAL